MEGWSGGDVERVSFIMFLYHDELEVNRLDIYVRKHWVLVPYCN